MPSRSGMSLGRGIQGTNLPTHLLPPPGPSPTPKSPSPAPLPPLCHPWSRFLPLPLCGACPFVGTVVFVLNKLLSQKEDQSVSVGHVLRWQESVVVTDTLTERLPG